MLGCVACLLLGAQAPQPPARFGNFRGAVIVIPVPTVEQLRPMCRSNALGLVACANVRKRPCRIYVLAHRNTPDVIAHERGHCAGWSGEHEHY
jgi:hypothetical protein